MIVHTGPAGHLETLFADVAASQGGTVGRCPGPRVYAIVGSGVLAALAFSTFALPPHHHQA